MKSELNHREKQQNTIKKALEIEEKKHSQEMRVYEKQVADLSKRMELL